MEYNYKPLPSNITIQQSDIHGLGLYAIKDIDSGVILGTSHIFDKRFEDGLYRGVLGAMINHSETPNCILTYYDNTYILSTSEIILSENELTLDYTKYLCGVNFKK